MALVGLNVISIFKCKRHYRSRVLRYKVEKEIESEFSLTLGKFICFVYMSCVLNVVSSKLLFIQAAIKTKW